MNKKDEWQRQRCFFPLRSKSSIVRRPHGKFIQVYCHHQGGGEGGGEEEGRVLVNTVIGKKVSFFCSICCCLLWSYCCKRNRCYSWMWWTTRRWRRKTQKMWKILPEKSFLTKIRKYFLESSIRWWQTGNDFWNGGEWFMKQKKAAYNILEHSTILEH